MKSVNRISELCNMKTKNIYKYVEFEKYDHGLTQKVTKTQAQEFEEEDDQDDVFNAIEDIITQKVTISHETQMLKTLNLWIGHCRVDLSRDIKNLIVKIEGVESLDIMTRYRFRVGIGNLFEENAVKNNIAKRIENFIDQKRCIKS